MLSGKSIIFAVTNDLTYDRRMDRICTALASEGAKVMLVGRKRRGSKSFSADHYEGVRFRCWFNSGALFYAEYNIRLFVFLLRQSFDIACACDLDTALAVRLAAWIKKKKTVYDAHEYFTEVPELIGRPGVKRIWNWVARKTIPGFDLRYTVGEELAILMGDAYGVHFDVVRNIAPVERMHVVHPGYDERKNMLFYHGALNVGRGLESCIQAMKELPTWELWLAGKGDITDSLKDLSKNLGLDNQVKFLGWVAPDDLPSYWNQARLGINLLEESSVSYYYSLANKFFDYISASLPSLNMNFPEYVKVNDRYPCAILIHDATPANIVNAVNDIDQHPEKWNQMAQACHAASKEFTWEKESQRLIGLYKDL